MGKDRLEERWKAGLERASYASPFFHDVKYGRERRSARVGVLLELYMRPKVVFPAMCFRVFRAGGGTLLNTNGGDATFFYFFFLKRPCDIYEWEWARGETRQNKTCNRSFRRVRF